MVDSSLIEQLAEATTILLSAVTFVHLMSKLLVRKW